MIYIDILVFVYQVANTNDNAEFNLGFSYYIILLLVYCINLLYDVFLGAADTRFGRWDFLPHLPDISLSASPDIRFFVVVD